MPTKTSRKTLKGGPPDKPKRNNVNFILSDEEQRRIQGEMIAISRHSGIPLKLGSYAKHALLSHRQLRHIVDRMRNLLVELGEEDAELSIGLATRVSAILQEAA
jgi:hypothetical protein